jgi:predicted membrane protein
VLVIVGVESMSRSYRRLFGVALALAGGLLLVHSLALAPLEWGLVWPVLIIGLGVILIIKVFTRRRRMPVPAFARDLPPDSVIMGSKEDRVDSQEYAGGEVSTVMGSYVLDLRGAEMSGERATVVARAVMGAVEIRVPSHWRVEVEARPVLGAVENRTHEPVDATRTLVVQADVVLGGLEIRN